MDILQILSNPIFLTMKVMIEFQMESEYRRPFRNLERVAPAGLGLTRAKSKDQITILTITK